jgi:hypothetical protein
MVFNNNLLLGAAGQGGGYAIDQSIRFNAPDTPRLYRTPSSTGDVKTWTYSVWLKRSNICTGGGVTSSQLFCARVDGNNTHDLVFLASSTVDGIRWQDYDTGVAEPAWNLETTQVFRDVSGWYHLLFVVDTTDATSTDRCKIYVNGERVTAFNAATYPSLNYASAVGINTTNTHNISTNGAGANPFDGYMAEINFIDGQALDASYFGEVNSDTGQWVPIKYTGSYGTNGFYITGADSADLGADYSGNGNDFTSSGLTSTDQVPDSPTDNYATWNVNAQASAASTVSDGNLTSVGSSGTYASLIAAIFPLTSGKWYWECTQSGAQQCRIGVVANSWVSTATGITLGGQANEWAYRGNNGQKVNAGTSSAYGSSYTAGDIIGVAVDVDAGKIWFAKNGTWQNSGDPAAGTGEAFNNLFGTIVPAIEGYNGSGFVLNAGQFAFSYSAPTGFNAGLKTSLLSDPTIALPSDYFQTVLDTGANIKATSEALYTDQFEWIKDRANVNNHQLIDSVRGTSAVIWSNGSTAETTYSTPSGNSVGWVWNQNGTGSSNTDGTITSTVAANTTSGFSTVTYTGSGVANDTVGHGLGISPAMIMCFCLDSTANGIRVFHEDLTAGQSLYLNTTLAAGAEGDRIASPTSTTFTVTGTAANKVNGSGDDYLAYCFAEVEGYSKFSSYTGNGSTDGSFVYCGFRPAFVMLKSSSQISSWYMFDSVRGPYNQNNNFLEADQSAAERTDRYIDFLSNGFKLRTSNDPNATETWVYAAFAEFPFKNANAR